MTDGFATRAKNSRIGTLRNALVRSVMLREHARKTWSERVFMNRKRLTNDEIKARLIFVIGVVLAMVFFFVTVGITYALIFVTQPIGAQAPNDAAFIDLLKTLAIFLTGSLGGVLASNGLKDRNKAEDTPTDTPKT